MLEFYAAKFLAAHSQVAGIGGFASHSNNDGGGFGLVEPAWQEHIGHATALSSSLAELGLTVSKAAADRIITALSKSPGQHHQIGTVHVYSKQETQQLTYLISETCQRISDELGSRFLLSIPAEKAPFYTGKKTTFRGDVPAKFPSLQYEIEEAGKCYALGRSTACVFHAVRALEAGLRAFARCLGIPDPTTGSQRNWQYILDQLKKEIDRRWPKPAARFTGDGKDFEFLYAGLAAMKNPYRNSTAHLDAVYTEDNATYFLDVIGGFMSALASRMDEQGQPFA
jgi:hypothetical protein